ncbi:amidohydrolase [Terrilactibacillus sp. BCM23-1]|uniref:Amidohydrolase n=1 Tax=Terrilactibacillus tamarindi TaxID=2599694 RepID=A0A6N8CLL9_9BACI|nr:amidohydrolase [Terrilactibacillus tamarindi]MTT30842.1 amidohydrolase [Terrilactibacillus tamarindi]
MIKIIENLEEELISVRHDLHSEPELSNEEFETTKKIRNWLNKANIRILDVPLRTGLIAEVSGNPTGPVIAIRGDIDALPIHEEADVSYRSKYDGVMHACGHDFHTASILGAAYLLKQKESFLKGTVRIIFQPAEETGHGAKAVLNSQGLKNVQAIFGLHNKPSLKLGELGTRIGPSSAGVDRFEIHVEGIGTHAAHPDLGIDPILVTGHIITALQSIVSRNIDWQDSAVVSVTHIQSGNTWNVIPSTAYLEGTVRTFSDIIREEIPKRIRTIIEGIATTFGAKATLTWHPGPPSVVNDKGWTPFTFDVAKESGFSTVEIEPSAGGEDFAFYQQQIPGTFVDIGTSQPYNLHHPKFTVDDAALLPSAKFFALLAERALERLDH